MHEADSSLTLNTVFMEAQTQLNQPRFSSVDFVVSGLFSLHSGHSILSHGEVSTAFLFVCLFSFEFSS